MAPTVRPPHRDELGALSELCFRSKAVWGYDSAFMEACRAELRVAPAALETSLMAVAVDGARILGLAQVTIDGAEADLAKLFVEPSELRRGLGRLLLDWACAAARACGAERMTIESDPGAAPFYRRMGATHIGEVPSGSIPGRMLPKLAIDLQAAARRRAD